ncbi:MAG TPA: Sir2 family NAD-dependent protein deacetylase, partial [Anaeromyxobacter sp.]|nr:Sir2 family NAD-dependent protein deacetylase [Anaeromyxobacter sp.]
MEPKLLTILEGVREVQGRVVVLTGAGVSAESGIPTFRGTEGYWVVGSKNHMPQEMATRAMFEVSPAEVWRWYLYRFGVCRLATPNDGHRALVRLEEALGERFTLVTQNIDGLHRRAGSRRVYSIHGEAAYVRCAAECGGGLLELPEFPTRGKDDPFTKADRARLTCPRCGGWLRPHVLWFDEYYDEAYYKMESTLRAVEQADLLLVVGTSGATNLPMQMGRIAFARGKALVDVNVETNPFATMAERSDRGF